MDTEEIVRLPPQRKVSLVVVGAGNRGKVYSKYALERPDLCQVVGIAEPRDITRELMVAEYNIPKENVFKDWKDLAKLNKKIADAVIITTQDRMHTEPAIHFANLGYHILLEKPMAPTEQECRAIVEAVEKNKVILAVGHVLRYTPYTQKIKQLIDSGAIGKVINIQHMEPVGWFHHAHSYVRGNWRNTKEASFMLMAKSCHDIDWIAYVLGSDCVKVSSFGSLVHFRKENKPNGAGNRCIDCSVEADCPYSAKKIYLEPVVKRGLLQRHPTSHPPPGKDATPVEEADYHVWKMLHILTEVPTVESVNEALEKGPYGRCVYECDNDVVDNQVVNMQFKNGTTASFTMVAFSQDVCIRKTRIFGTKGQIEGDSSTITHFDFLTKQEKSYRPDDDFNVKTTLTGHGGADYFLMKSFIEAVIANDPSKVLSSAQETLRSHVAVFAAENARVEDKIVKLDW